MRDIGILFLGLCITGCVTKVLYKTGVSEFSYKQDSFGCMQSTGYTELSPGQAMAAGALAAQNPTLTQLQNPVNRENMFVACMEALGYQQLSEDQVAAMKKKD